MASNIRESNLHNSYLRRRHVPEKTMRRNIFHRTVEVALAMLPDRVPARARASNRKIRIPPTGVGACISNAAENADCRCQRLGGPTANFRQAVFHKSRRSPPQRAKQLCNPAVVSPWLPSSSSRTSWDTKRSRATASLFKFDVTSSCRICEHLPCERRFLPPHWQSERWFRKWNL